MSGGEHSRIPPSSSARRQQCPASTTMEEGFPETEDGEAAAEGTAAHWAVSETLSGRMVDVGEVAPNGVRLTAEMIRAADQMYADVALELAPYGMRPEQGDVEQRIAIPRVHAESWGTPDYTVWVPGTRGLHLFLYDFKFGHRIVEVFENEQCVEYVAGALARVLDSRGYSDQDINVTIKIVQPRAYHKDGAIRSWSFKASDIRALINRASNAAHEALGPNPKAHVGPECRDCRARHACPTLQKAALSACDVAGKAQPFDLPPAALAHEYLTLKRHAALLSARLTGIEEQCLSLARAGAILPGLRIEHGNGRMRWNIPATQVIAIGAALGVNVAQPPEVLTPKQAVEAGLPEATLAGLTTTPRGAATLAEDDGSTARRLFA